MDTWPARRNSNDDWHYYTGDRRWPSNIDSPNHTHTHKFPLQQHMKQSKPRTNIDMITKMASSKRSTARSNGGRSDCSGASSASATPGNNCRRRQFHVLEVSLCTVGRHGEVIMRHRSYSEEHTPRPRC